MLKVVFAVLFIMYNSMSYAQECSYQQKCDLGDPDMINIHIVSHSHNDAGWLKTVDEYYTGTKKYIDKAGVQYILDSIVESLEQDPARKFSYVEGAFMYRWLTGRSDFDRHRISRLVQQGQLEILSGGWVQNDEACAHYNDIINQMALGFKIYKDAFGACGIPRTGWQIDPFGHSAGQATLLAAMGFDALFFGRVSDSTKSTRMMDHSLEFLWHPLPRCTPQNINDAHIKEIYGDRSFVINSSTPNTDSGAAPNSSNSDMFVSILPNVYWPPPGFCFDIFCDDDPIQDNPVESGYNMPERVSAFLSEMERQSRNYDTNHLIVTMGNDFNYQSGDNWFRNLDKLIRYVNQQRSLNGSSLEFNAFYSTPGCYSYALNQAKSGGPKASLKRKRQSRRRFMTNKLGTTLAPTYQKAWPELKGGDFFPLVNAGSMIWTGFYTSRPTLKGMIRDSSRFLQVCKQIDALALLQPHHKHDIRQLDRAVALAQHHDAVTGTAKQAVSYDYAHRLSVGHEECMIAIGEGLRKLSVIGKQENLRFCPLLNISRCAFTQTHPEFDIVVYNPLAWPIDTYVTVPVRKAGLTVSDTNGTILPFQVIPLPQSLRRIPERRTESSHDSSTVLTPRDDKVNVLTFPAKLPALGAARFTVRTSNSIQKSRDLSSNDPSTRTRFAGDIEINSVLQPDEALTKGPLDAEEGDQDLTSDDQDYFIENEILRLEFDPVTNHISKLTNKKTGLTTALNQTFGYYGGSVTAASSGAYVFRSHTLVPNDLSHYSSGTTLKILKGPVLQQARQSFAPWIDQEITLYLGVPAVELTWTVGPIPVNDSVAKDVVTRFHSDLASWQERADNASLDNIFYTDSNARFVVQRRLTLQPDAVRREPNFIARNYYPLTSRIFIKDELTERSTSGQAPRQLGILVDRAQGGTSPDKGTLEIMLHRRLLTDDHLGVNEPLNEKGVDGQGLIARGKHWLIFDAPMECDAILTKMAQIQYLKPQVMFVVAQSKPPKIPYDGQFVSNPLPPNLHLLSFAQWERSILLRLEHIYAPGEHSILSQPVSIDLTKIFATFTVTRITEMSLGANQLLSEVNRFKWPVQDSTPESIETRPQSPRNISIHHILLSVEFTAKTRSLMPPRCRVKFNYRRALAIGHTYLFVKIRRLISQA